MYAAALNAIVLRENLATLNSAPLRQQCVAFVDDEAVKSYAGRVDARLRALLWPNARIVLWYDEVQQLLAQPRLLFMRKTDYTAPLRDAVPTVAHDVLCGLTAVSASLMDGCGWLQVLCGPWLELAERLQLSSFSCVHDRVNSLHHVSTIGVENMLNSICTYFDVDADGVKTRLGAQLERLCGRPRWFFDGFWVFMWARLQSAWEPREVPHPPLSAVALLDHIASAMDDAVREGTETARKLVQAQWNSREEGDQRTSMQTLCKELYMAIKLNDAVITRSTLSATRNAIHCGLFATSAPADVSVPIKLSCEPLVCGAIEELGDSITRKCGVDDDPIFGLLARFSDAGTLGGLAPVRRRRGRLLEVAFAWHVARTCIKRGGCSSLSGVITPLLASGIDHPDDVGLRTVTVTRARPAASLPPTLATNFQAFLIHLPAGDAAIIGVEAAAGASTIVPLSSGLLITLALARGAHWQLVDALTAASPAWQLIDESSRTDLSTGVLQRPSDEAPHFVHSPQRHALECFAADPASAPFFSSAVRMLLSVTPFHGDSVRYCNILNSDPSCTESPVLSSSRSPTTTRRRAAARRPAAGLPTPPESRAAARPAPPTTASTWLSAATSCARRASTPTASCSGTSAGSTTRCSR